MDKRKDAKNIGEEDKDQQLDYFREDSKDTNLTTNFGVKVSHTDDSLKAGPRGPTLMEDFHFREKITHFDHERIPERVVHARGTGAHGYFECLKPMGEFTAAKFLQEEGKRTPVFVRFSTVAGFRGSADTVRDVRGFATKFYTEDGNYDLVGNNIPVFFIQDGIKFPDLIHAVKPEPDNEMPQAASAHDTFWDFVASAPENAHMIMWHMSDRAIPRSYRMMEGFSVNTFRFVNEKGKGRFIKFIWKPLLGVHSLLWDEAQKLAGKDPDFHRRDLYDAIDAGDFPEYELYVQMIDEKDEDKFDFDILDATKVWPEELIPPVKIGRLVLNRRPDNFFAEVEQVAFCPGNVVRGIDFSNDPLLQARLFSYIDTQISRLGGPNFNEIPINKPLAPVHDNQRDGMHRMTINTTKTSYFPNTLDDNDPTPASWDEGGYVSYMEKVDGRKVRERDEKFKDFFIHARLFWNSMSEPEKKHIIRAFCFEVGKVEDKNVRQLIVDMFANVDKGLAAEIANGVGAKPPSKGADASKAGKSPAVSMANTRKDSIKSRMIAILAEDGVSGAELMAVRRSLEDAGGHVKIISSSLGTIEGADGKIIIVDKSFLTAASVMFDAVLVAGGKKSIDSLKADGDAIHFINEAFKHCKAIGAIDDGIGLLEASSIEGVTFSDSKGKVKSELGVVTVGTGADMDAFSKEFIKAIAQHRHWDRETLKGVPA
ncbi:MAG: catalase [Methanotrichaceae archaeon]